MYGIFGLPGTSVSPSHCSSSLAVTDSADLVTEEGSI